MSKSVSSSIQKEPVNLAILGSCVTRDAFAFVKNNFQIQKFISRTSFISIMSEPVLLDQEIKPETNFLEKCIRIDFNKAFFDEIQSVEFDYFILDFIDERFNIYETEGNYVTNSLDLERAGYTNNDFNVIKGGEEETFFLWKKSCKRFMEKLLKLIPEDKIILHKAYWATKYIDEEKTLEFNKPTKDWALFNNKNLVKFYEFIESNYSEIKTINMESHAMADNNHKWVLTPFYYYKPYYDSFMEELIALT